MSKFSTVLNSLQAHHPESEFVVIKNSSGKLLSKSPVDCVPMKFEDTIVNSGYINSNDDAVLFISRYN